MEGLLEQREGLLANLAVENAKLFSLPRMGDTKESKAARKAQQHVVSELIADLEMMTQQLSLAGSPEPSPVDHKARSFLEEKSEPARSSALKFPEYKSFKAGDDPRIFLEGMIPLLSAVDIPESKWVQAMVYYSSDDIRQHFTYPELFRKKLPFQEASQLFIREFSLGSAASAASDDLYALHQSSCSDFSEFVAKWRSLSRTLHLDINSEYHLDCFIHRMVPALRFQIQKDRLIKTLTTFNAVWLHAKELDAIQRRQGAKSNSKKPAFPSKPGKSSARTLVCHHCQREGHIRPDCDRRHLPPVTPSTSASSVSAQGTRSANPSGRSFGRDRSSNLGPATSPIGGHGLRSRSMPGQRKSGDVRVPRVNFLNAADEKSDGSYEDAVPLRPDGYEVGALFVRHWPEPAVDEVNPTFDPVLGFSSPELPSASSHVCSISLPVLPAEPDLDADSVPPLISDSDSSDSDSDSSDSDSDSSDSDSDCLGAGDDSWSWLHDADDPWIPMPLSAPVVSGASGTFSPSPMEISALAQEFVWAAEVWISSVAETPGVIAGASRCRLSAFLLCLILWVLMALCGSSSLVQQLSVPSVAMLSSRKVLTGSSSSPFMAPCSVQGVQASAFVDGGSDITVINRQFALRLGLSIQPSSGTLHLRTGRCR